MQWGRRCECVRDRRGGGGGGYNSSRGGASFAAHSLCWERSLPVGMVGSRLQATGSGDFVSFTLPSGSFSALVQGQFSLTPRPRKKHPGKAKHLHVPPEPSKTPPARRRTIRSGSANCGHEAPVLLPCRFLVLASGSAARSHFTRERPTAPVTMPSGFLFSPKGSKEAGDLQTPPNWQEGPRSLFSEHMRNNKPF